MTRLHVENQNMIAFLHLSSTNDPNNKQIAQATIRIDTLLKQYKKTIDEKIRPFRYFKCLQLQWQQFIITNEYIVPNAPNDKLQQFTSALEKHAGDYGLNTPLRLAAFIASVMHEVVVSGIYTKYGPKHYAIKV